MFLFGIENIFQKVINSWKIPFTFRECNPLGYYFHDYYSVFYVDVSYEFEELEKNENEDAKEIIKKIIDKLDRALDEMEQYVGKKGSNR